MTPEATDLVARLRKEASKAGMMLSDPPQPSPVMAVCDEAATLIEAQAAEIEGLKRERDEAHELMTAAIKRGAPAYGEPGSF